MPRVVLLDRNMPVLDGIGFLKVLRSEFGEGAPGVVMCTTEAAMDRILEGLEAGAQEYVMKPFDEAILLEKLALVGVVPA
jgi:two-component system chemotaxis response regulator CheY